MLKREQAIKLIKDNDFDDDDDDDDYGGGDDNDDDNDNFSCDSGDVGGIRLKRIKNMFRTEYTVQQ